MTRLNENIEVLLHSESRLRKLMMRMPAVVSELAPDGKILHVSEAVFRIFGYHSFELLEKNWWDVFYPGELRRQVEELLELLKCGDVTDHEMLLMAKDGSTRVLSFDSSNRYAADGTIEAFVWVGLDITEHKKVGELRSRMSAILEATSDFVATAGTDGTLLCANSAARVLLGIGTDEDISRLAIADIHPEWARKIILEEGIPSALRDGAWKGNSAIRSANGKETPVSQVIIAHRATDGTVEFLSTIARDITEHQRGEDRLRQMNDELESRVRERTLEFERANNILEAEIKEHTKAEKALQGSHKILKAISQVQSQYIVDTDPADLFEALLVSILSLTDSEYGFFGEVLYDDNNQPYLKPHAFTTLSKNEETRRFFELHGPLVKDFRNTRNLFNEVFMIGKLVIANYPSEDPRSNGLPEGHPFLRGFMGLPIYFGDKLVGMAGIANRPGGYNQELAEYLDPLLVTCANIIEAHKSELMRKQAEEELKQAHAELESKIKERTESLVRVNGELTTGIIERMRIEEQLRESEERFRGAFEYAAIGMTLVAPNGRFLKVNPVLCEITGYSEEELLEMSFRDITHPEDLEINQRQVAELISDKVRTYQIEKRYIHKRGHVVWVNLNVSLVRDIQGKPLHFVSQVQDITERKKVEWALQESENRFRALFNNAHDAVVLHEFSEDGYLGRFIEVNDVACERLGYSREELLTMSPQDYVPAEYHEKIPGILETLLNQRHNTFEIVNVSRNGVRIPVEISAHTFYLEGRRVVLSLSRDIRERKQIEEALRESEERYRQLVDLSPDAIAVHSEGKVVFVNSAALQLIAADKPEDMIGKPMMSFVHPNYRDTVGERVRQMIGQGAKVALMEEKFLKMDGSSVDVEVAAMPLTYKGKAAMLVVGRNVSERKQTQEALKQSEEQFRAIFEGAPVGIALVAPNGTLTEANHTFSKMLGYSRDELCRMAFSEFTHPEDRTVNLGLFHELIAGERDGYQMEKRYLHKEGGVVWGRLSVTAFRSLNERSVFALAMVEDITDQKQVAENLQQALEETQRRSAETQSLLEGARAVLAHQDFNDAIKLIYESCKGLIGSQAGYVSLLSFDGTENRILFLDLGDLSCRVDPSLSVPNRGLRALAHQQGKVIYHNDFMSTEWASLLPDGHLSLENVLLAPLVLRGRVVGLIVLGAKPGGFTENDARMAAAFGELASIALQNSQTLQSLESSEERFRSVVQTANDAVISADASGNIVFWNQAAEVVFGYSCEEIVGQPLSKIMPERFKDLHLNGMARLAKSGSTRIIGKTIELAGLRRNGTEFPMELSLANWKTREGTFFTGIVRDITERKRMEEHLLRAQRLETAGRIAGQVAHDFNNLLSPLVGYPELIKMELPEGHPASQICDAMVKAAEQMADINEDLMALGRRGHFNQEPTDLNRLVEQATRQIMNPPSTLQLEINLAEDLLPVTGSSAQLLRVISNLLSNSCEAMQDSGNLYIRTENVYIDAPFGRYSRIEVGEYVMLEVRDTGKGIPPEIKDKVFDAFFTTRRSGKSRGSGLGLSVVQAIVDDHRGYVDFESEVEKGTAFSVYLPVSRDVQKELKGKSLERGNETILIVDDDEVQRELLTRLLRSQGYMVSIAIDGEQALDYLKRDSADLLVLDMIMPGMDGTETYRRILEIRPNQRAIILSGFAESERVQEAQSLGAGAYVRKPVTLTKLTRAVREELDR